MEVFAGFDLGGTDLKYGLIDQDHNLVFHDKISSPERASELVRLLRSLWETLNKRAKSSIRSVGFGFPGIYSAREKKILQSPNYQGIENYDFISALSEFIPVSFQVDNDANVAAYGEYKSGAGRGAHSMVLLTIGTGLGTGIVLQGKLWQGACGFAGELGHAPVRPQGDRCKCGSQGCLETEVSAQKIILNYQKNTGSQHSYSSQEIYQKAQQGDQNAIEAFSEAGRFLGIGIAIAINLLNPDKIIIGGGVMNAADLLLPPAHAEAQRRSYRAAFDCCTIEQATLGNQAGFIGAACWAKDNLNL